MSKRATALLFTDDKFIVSLADRRELPVSLEWFFRLRNVTGLQRQNGRFIGNGAGIHWEDLDEDILAEKLLEWSHFNLMVNSFL
ncbi:MAG: DUF2442 domain-containing protein [Bacteroidetes bacterium]|nr:DUF2442 domain-containing protein [Bacteroidota bacterium]